jgi:transcriptional regulator with XRE-family HTH domain
MSQEVHVTTGQKIRKLRKAKDWTQGQLASAMGMNYYNVNRYEHDRVRPRAKLLQRFADALEVRAEELEADPAEEEASSFKDQELYQQMKTVDRLNEADRSALKRIIQAVIIKNQVQNLTRTG